MLRRHQSVWRTLFAAADIALSLGLFCAAFRLRFHPLVTAWFPAQAPVPPLEIYIRVLPVLGLILLVANTSQRLYSPRREGSLLAEFGDILKATVLAVVLFTAILFFERSRSYARGIIGIFAVLNPLGAMGLRLAVRSVLRSARRRGYNLRHVLIVGTGRTAQALIHRIRQHPWTGIRILGLVGDREDRIGKRIHDVPVVGSAENLEGVLAEHPADQVFIALPTERSNEIEPIIRVLSERMMDIRIVPPLGILLGMAHRLDSFDGLPILSLWESPLVGWNAFLKRAMDLAVGLMAFCLSLPFFAAIAILVKATSQGPVFFRQPRMGLDGKLFQIIKFRTMRAGSDDGTEPSWTRPADPRCTPFGRFLRKTSLDELPQLLNVISGQMSLVGPRPERPVFIEKFKKSIPRYMVRHKVKAGITGWAQVNGYRGDTSLKKRLQYDLYYLQHWSLGFDLKILAMTLVRGLSHPNAY